MNVSVKQETWLVEINVLFLIYSFSSFQSFGGSGGGGGGRSKSYGYLINNHYFFDFGFSFKLSL